MITALQNFISKKGKIVFVLLLFVVVISFVLYLAQGASVFDLLPDPNREKEEFYGYDLNDPDQMRYLSTENRVASDFGAVIPPLEESILEADRRFMESLQAQLQAAFQANQEDVDRSALQKLFGFMQSWPNLPKNFKVREIARSGGYEPVFSQASIKAKLVMDAQAKSWSYLSEDESHVGIDDGFKEYVLDLEPSLAADENRSKILSYVGMRQGVKTSFVESSLFGHFRANQVDKVYSEGGFTLNKEGELDLFADQFAWKAKLLSLNADDLNTTLPSLFTLSILSQPKEDDSLSIIYGSLERNFVFVRKIMDRNSSDIMVKIGAKKSDTIKNLFESLKKEKIDLKIVYSTELSISLIPKLDSLPRMYPSLVNSGDAFEIKSGLEENLRKFHEDNKNDDLFIEPSRTFATMVTFAKKDFISLPPAPDESRLRSYFELNRDQFAPAPIAPLPDSELKGEKGPIGENDSNQTSLDLNLVPAKTAESNNTEQKEVFFEDVKEEIRLRIVEEDRLDAEREANDIAREKSLEFLDKINALRDQIKGKYSTFSKKRNSAELISLLEKCGGTQRKISFTDDDMGVQASILGLERRESERRKNREPLEEVSSLNESLFFTRSSRTVRDGFSVFLLDRKTEKSDGVFKNASFADLYRGFKSEIRANEFVDLTEDTFTELQRNENDQDILNRGKLIFVDGKNIPSLQSSFNTKNELLRSRLSKLESEREEISKADRDSNFTDQQSSRKDVLDKLINEIRVEQDEQNQNRTLSIKLLEACPNLEIESGWSELERTEDVATFAKLISVYSLKVKQAKKEEIITRVQEIELSRSENDRDLILGDLLRKELSKSSSN